METKARRCVLDEERPCSNCGECDLCDLDPMKICDNCMKCITSGADYLAVEVDEILEEESRLSEYEDEDGKD